MAPSAACARVYTYSLYAHAKYFSHAQRQQSASREMAQVNECRHALRVCMRAVCAQMWSERYAVMRVQVWSFMHVSNWFCNVHRRSANTVHIPDVRCCRPMGEPHRRHHMTL